MLASVGLYEPSDYKVIRDSYSKFLSQLDLHSNNHSISAPELLQGVETARLFKKYVRYYITAIKKNPKGFTGAFDMPDPLAFLS